MKSISEITREMKVTDFMLREWEKRGYFGDVIQVDGKRMYSDEQIERIAFIIQEVAKQRKQGIKRTEYSKIDEAFHDKFGGEVVVREEHDPALLMTNFMKKMEDRDRKIYENFDTMKEIMQMILDKPVEVQAPDMTKYDELVEHYKQLSDAFEKLADHADQLKKDNLELKRKNATLEKELEEERKKKKRFLFF